MGYLVQISDFTQADAVMEMSSYCSMWDKHKKLKYGEYLYIKTDQEQTESGNNNM